jgi:secondary thiamine-phosphate synthase enzyme
MKFHRGKLQVRTSGKGMTNITEGVQAFIHDRQIEQGMCHLFIQHTSASLVINESFDPTAQKDMESFLERLVPEHQAWMAHTLEGGDDCPSHLRTMLTNVSLSIPIDNGQLALGTWQGIYLFEHRRQPHNRKVLIRCAAFDEEEIVDP